MVHRIPEEAFEHYFALGADRSYQALADRYGVSKRAVTKKALRENWQARIREREEKTRAAVASKVEESIEELNARHLRILKAIQAKALEALKTMPMAGAMDAVRSLDLSLKQERLIYGEPSDRTAVSVEDTIKREYGRWMEVGDGDD